MDRVSMLNGPNLNLLGEREPERFGRTTLAEIKEACERRAAKLEFSVDFKQSNHEGQIIDWIHEARRTSVAMVLNPAALGATSLSIVEALKTFDGPIVEVHLTNVHRTGDFHSKVSPIAKAVIAGLGAEGYLLALDAIHRILRPGQLG